MFISWLLSFIAGPLLSNIVAAYKQKLENASKQDVLAVDLAKAEIQAEIAARASANQVIIAEQGRWYTACIRPLLAFPIIIYFWKVIVWDKVFGWGTTDPILGMAGDWAGWIVVAYVGGRSLEKISRVFANR